MLKIFQDHGREQKRHLHNIVKRDISAVYRVERKVIQHLGLSARAWEEKVKEKLEMADDDSDEKK